MLVSLHRMQVSLHRAPLSLWECLCTLINFALHLSPKWQFANVCVLSKGSRLLIWVPWWPLWFKPSDNNAHKRGIRTGFICSIFLNCTCMHWRYLFSSFWLVLLCITDSRFIHISTNNLIFSFLWLSNIPLYIWTMSSLSIKPLKEEKQIHWVAFTIMLHFPKVTPLSVWHETGWNISRKAQFYWLKVSKETV